jgi:cell division protein ZapA
MAEYSKIDSFKRQSLETQSVLMELNIADDYFKAKKQIAVLEEEKELKEQEIYSLKHDLIASKIKLESLEKTMKAMQEDIAAKDKEIVHLENVKQTATKNGK